LHLGLILPNYGAALGADTLASAALGAEESGFDSAWVTDHLIVPEEHAPIYGSIAEPLVSLGFLAARTRALELGVSRRQLPAARVMLRIGVYLEPEPREGTDERGRHAITGPPEWVAEPLAAYVEARCDGFVVNLDHERPGLEERVRRFAAEVSPLLPRATS
jgi:alkanesulfonate monooxygenase SsuD/methylene tetrahydromethanopterin reductase-like flavin-dependent oxidoreductase (luciferase family)